MQKIFQLTSQDFMRGIAVSSHYPSSGIFIDAAGINPFINPFTAGSDLGLLQGGSSPTDIAGSTVVDTILGAALLGSAYRAYFIGSDGHFYEQNTSADTEPTDLRSGTQISNPAEGVAIYQAAGGTKYLYYAREAFIGRWDLSGTYPTGWTDAYAGSGGSGFSITLQSTPIRNFHHFVGNCYFTDKNYVGGITDDGDTTLTIASGLLDLPSTLTIVDLDDDGYHLVIAATENAISGNASINTINKIYFWNTFENSWQREWEINTPYIAAIKRIGTTMYALCADGIYAFNYSTPPTLALPLDTGDGPSKTGGVNPTSHIATVLHNVLYWTSASQEICAFGSPLPGLSQRFFKPFKGFADGVTSLLFNTGKYRFYTADADEYGFINNAQGGATGVVAETIFIPLERKWNILRIEVVLGEPLASGDSLNIDVKSDEDTSAADWGTISYAAHGAVRTVVLPGKYIAENLKLVLNFNAGAVKIKKIMVYGDPMNI